MKITIDVDELLASRAAALLTPSIPIPPPELLERAKALGAISAGPANLGLRAPTDLPTRAAEAPESAPKRKAGKSPARRKPAR